VLLVEDNADEVVIIKEKLKPTKNLSFNVMSVGTLEDALHILAEREIDVVMLDLILPDSRGRNTFTQVYSRFPEIPVIILTCIDDEDMAISMMHEGAQDYLVKGQSDLNIFARVVCYAIERNNVKKAARETVTRLRELNEIKSQFVAEASHEIRTPLAIIREFVALVHDGVTGALNDKQREYLASALRNCDKLTDLINHILDLARIESGKKELRLIKLDMASVLAQFLNDFLPLAKSKKQTLLLEVAKNLPKAHGDAGSIQNILTNLIGNAHKFAPEGGTIRITCREEGQFLRTFIEDNGPGIPPDQQERIFESFIQIPHADGSKPKGTGLGLKIAKSLIEMNGGHIALESQPGKGSSFSFTLPIYDKQIPRRILIVDDEEPVVRLIERILKSSDFHLEVKSTLKGLGALVVAGEFKPDLVILDMYLNDVDGKQVLASLKQTPQNPCKIMMISGDHTRQNELKEYGADAFLPKPFSADDMLDKIQFLLGLEPKTYLMPDYKQNAPGSSGDKGAEK